MDFELTILMPCLNEAATVGPCVVEALDFLTRTGIRGEVLIADNGSSDASIQLALDAGARVVSVQAPGYGSALLGGINAARGRYVIMGDCDASYDFSKLEPFVAQLRGGFDLVMGNRFRGGIAKGAMPALHYYVGNPVLSTVGKLLFHTACDDFHCGLRGFNRAAILALDLRAQGMEFASEMVVKATLAKLRVTEVPTTLSPDGRSRASHLRTWHDGWRHLRFLILFAPQWLFLYPGLALMLAALLGLAATAFGPLRIGNITFDIGTLYYSALGLVVAFQLMHFWAFTKINGERGGIVPHDPRFDSLIAGITLERMIFVGLTLVIAGLALGIFALGNWGSLRFGPLPSASESMRLVIPSGTAIILGMQILSGGFFISILRLQLPEKRRYELTANADGGAGTLQPTTAVSER